MSQFIVDQTVSTALSQLREPTRVTDSQGRLLGVFTPWLEQEEEPFDLEAAEKALQEEKGLGILTSRCWPSPSAGDSAMIFTVVRLPIALVNWKIFGFAMSSCEARLPKQPIRLMCRFAPIRRKLWCRVANFPSWPLLRWRYCATSIQAIAW